MDKYICIHGHFYQPPRENAWLESIELQDSAYPYHDWNERITAECYASNAFSRILDDQGWIERIVNNYAKINFNFGPTLLAWMEANAPNIYAAILEADRQSLDRYDGHGSAIAQAYNHMIMPLANRRDKETQVIWGIRDFEKRFNRFPEGMWLPETAVDLESLEVLAEHGIRYTILAPYQAGRVRPLNGEEEDWRNIEGGDIDISRPYLQKLPSGREITIFFYDGPISRAVAFEGILSSGETFAGRIMDGFSEHREGPQLAHIATDGESYGHHHAHGDMALAYALHHIEENNLATLTNYGAFLAKHPPADEVKIHENTAWSCAHGIERWRSDCGCSSDGNPGWNQAWRAPLRESLDWLRDVLAAGFEKKSAALLKDPWEARNGYIDIILDRSPENLERFFKTHAATEATEADKITLLKLLEIQRQTLLMYTSCGWFFDEISGIEAVQVIQYAGRAIQLGEQFYGEALKPGFLKILEKAESNIPDHRNGKIIFKKFVEPAMVDLKKVGAHYAISSLFEDYADHPAVFCYRVDQQEYQTTEAGLAKLAAGVVTITSEITRESEEIDFGVLHFGDHNVSCGIRNHQGDDHYRQFRDEVFGTFERADFPSTIRALDKHLPAHKFSLTSLFHDEQRKVLDLVLASNLEATESTYRQIYNANAPLMRFLTLSHTPIPKALYTAGEVAVNADLRRSLAETQIDPDHIRSLLTDGRHTGLALDEKTLEFTFRKNLEDMAHRIKESPEQTDRIRTLEEAAALTSVLPFRTEMRKVQNLMDGVRDRLHEKMRRRAQAGDPKAAAWIEAFKSLCEQLTLRLE